MRILDELHDFIESIDLLSKSIESLVETLNRNAEPTPDSYPVSSEVGVFNPTEDDMADFLRKYGEFHTDAVSNPYRGWKVFRDDETENG